MSKEPQQQIDDGSGCMWPLAWMVCVFLIVTQAPAIIAAVVTISKSCH